MFFVAFYHFILYNDIKMIFFYMKGY